MSRDFLSNFEQPERKQEMPTNGDDLSPDSEAVEYEGGEYRQNLCFVWPDRPRTFYEYHALYKGAINADYTTIRLYFGQEVVELVGIYLMPLFNSIMAHKRRLIYCDDARYNEISESDFVVNEINLSQSL